MIPAFSGIMSISPTVSGLGHFQANCPTEHKNMIRITWVAQRLWLCAICGPDRGPTSGSCFAGLGLPAKASGCRAH
ncbi:MAG: hypothetical protein GX671_03355 [Clostridiales bacterium]|nr:hypothetical protein [Clostridiales bacterium]